MSSNIKPKNSAKDSPTEPFKRAVAGCLRAIARMPELEVAFAAERSGLLELDRGTNPNRWKNFEKLAQQVDAYFLTQAQAAHAQKERR